MPHVGRDFFDVIAIDVEYTPSDILEWFNAIDPRNVGVALDTLAAVSSNNSVAIKSLELNDLVDVESLDPEDRHMLVYVGGSNNIWLAQSPNEIIDDRVNDLLEAGNNITITYNDNAGTLVIASTGGGGSSDHGSLTGLGDDDHIQYLLASGTRGLSGNWDAGSFNITSETFTSDVATGTAPFTVSSTTLVSNLNADLLDGNEASAFALVSHDHALADLTDTFIPEPRDLEVLKYTGGSVLSWQSDFVFINELGDVDVSSATDGQVLTYIGGSQDIWVARDVAGGVTDHASLTGLANDDHTQYILANGTRALSSNWDAGSFSITAETFTSDVTTGTAPLTVSSTTLVSNLNADLLDSQEGTYYLDSSNFTGTNWSDLTDSGATTLHKHDHGNMDGLGDDDHTIYLLVDGTRGLSGNWDAGSFSITAETLVSDVTTGTAPFTVSSTTLVSSLNADLLDGSHASDFALASHSHFIGDLIDVRDESASDDQVLTYIGGSQNSWEPKAPDRSDKSFSWDGGGVAPLVNTGSAVGVTRPGQVKEAVLISYDGAGDRSSDTLTITVYKVDGGNAESTMGTISLSSSSYVYDTDLSSWNNTILTSGDTIKAEITTAGTTAFGISLVLRIEGI